MDSSNPGNINELGNIAQSGQHAFYSDDPSSKNTVVYSFVFGKNAAGKKHIKRPGLDSLKNGLLTVFYTRVFFYT